MVKAVIFDMDGVIIDSEPIHFVSDQMTLQDYGVEITNEELSKYVGISNPVMWSELREKYGLAAAVEELLAKQMYYKKLLFGGRELQCIEGIESLLRNLKHSGLKIGLASSSPREFIEIIINNLGLAGYFEAVVSGEEVERSKPAPDVFLRAAELLKVNPSDCMVIEDSEHGVKAAKAAGMKCIGYLNTNSGQQDLRLADKMVSSLKDIDFADSLS
ncbi:HAD family hydrolase [Syntrophobotulus glycolicus]|nr:HAD family hydrolase [Syntrophobotulus glycolicus]